MSDYEYQDYLGGRSFSGGTSIVDEDSVDPGEDMEKTPKSSSWFASPWIQKTKYALQFVLDSIEKPPK